MARLAGLLHPDRALYFIGLGAAGLTEHRQQHHLATRSQSVSHPGLLAEQMEAKLADFSLKVTGVGLAERLGTLGQHADQKVDSAEVAVGEGFEP